MFIHNRFGPEYLSSPLPVEYPVNISSAYHIPPHSSHMEVWGDDGKHYLLTKKIGNGKQGEIFLIHNSDLCCKIYKNLSPEKVTRLTLLIDIFKGLIQNNTLPRNNLCPPLEIIYDYKRVPKGYLMKYIPGRTLDYYTSTPILKVENYSLKDQLQLSLQIAHTVAALNKAGLVVGDIIQSNIIVKSDLTPVLIDLNSVGFTKDEIHYECKCFHIETMSPEHFSAEKKKERYVITKQDDSWAVQFLTFCLFFPGFEVYSYLNCVDIEEDTIKGNYFWYDNKRISPLAQKLYEALPPNLKLYFFHCFHNQGDFFHGDRRPDVDYLERVIKSCITER